MENIICILILIYMFLSFMGLAQPLKEDFKDIYKDLKKYFKSKFSD